MSDPRISIENTNMNAKSINEGDDSAQNTEIKQENTVNITKDQEGLNKIEQVKIK